MVLAGPLSAVKVPQLPTMAINFRTRLPRFVFSFLLPLSSSPPAHSVLEPLLPATSLVSACPSHLPSFQMAHFTTC